MKINQSIGATVVIKNCRDYVEPKVRVVQSTFQDAEDGEKAVHIHQGKGTGITLTLASLEELIKWLKTSEEK